MNWSDTPLTQRLAIDFPLIQAPLPDGIGSPELIAAAAAAGALGMVAAADLPPPELRAVIAAVRARSDRPFGVALEAPAPWREDWAAIDRALTRLAPYRAELGLPPAALPTPPPDFSEQLAVVLDERIAAVRFSGGVPGAADMTVLKQAGVVTLGAATHLLEALVLEECGIDIVIAQGIETGGPRATFLGDSDQGLVGSTALIPLLARYLRVPVVAASSLMDARGIAAARLLGAAGVQIGTAWLASPESGAPLCHKEFLLQGTEVATVLTRLFTGRPARALSNRLLAELRPYEADWPVYPVQRMLMRDFLQAAAQQQQLDFMALWAGQGCSAAVAAPVAELVRAWDAELRKW